MKTLNKKIIITVLMNMIIGLSANALTSKDSAAIASVNNQSALSNDTCTLKLLKAKQIENKNYINCFVLSKISNYYLVIEKSIDGKNFSILKMTKGCISPANQTLMYSFVDNYDSTTLNTTYRISAYKILSTKDGVNYIDNKLTNMFNQSQNTTVIFNLQSTLTKN